MYAKRVRIINYGPIEHLDITFPFDGDRPKPIVLVGENGSGKSILLSHIVNGLVSAKNVAYPDSPEVEPGKVYKLRSNSYISSGRDYYYGKVEFEDGLFVEEMHSQRNKREYESLPAGLSGADEQSAWNKIESQKNDHFDSSFLPDNKERIAKAFSENCVLYFPHNRFEEPAWLNEENLKIQAQYMDTKRIEGYTDRKLIEYSPLHANQNWLLDLLYDRAVFEFQTLEVSLPVRESNAGVPLPVFTGYSGSATSTYEIALRIVRNVVRRDDARFGVGRRNDRRISIESGMGQVSPILFQMSSGETALLNLFLSILRDFGLSGAPFSTAADVRGIVVVDEIDLHLHAIHQHEVLPVLIEMFPNVQFVVTTHSPLFVLGMAKSFGEEGVGVYRMPQGERISPEEFSEFGVAYQALTETDRYQADIRTAIEKAQKPIVFVEGATDEQYVAKASKLLGKEAVLDSLELRDGAGKGNLSKVWKDALLPLTEILPQQVLLLFDCDTDKASGTKGKLVQRTIPFQDQHPIEKGIENLFSKSTLEMARQHKPAFFSTEDEHGGTNEDGQPITIPEKWSISNGEKTNLCEWLCENGTREDFQHFQSVFDLIEEAIDLS